MFEFIIQYWLEILFGLIVSTLTALLTYYKKQYNKLQEIKKIERKTELENLISQTFDNAQYQTRIEKMIEDKLSFVETRSDDKDTELQESLRSIKDDLKTLQSAFVIFFYDRLKDYSILLLEKPFIYLDELENFQNLYDSYKALGGNGHMETFREKIIRLPIKNREEG